MVRKSIPMEHLPKSRSTGELGSQATEAAQSTTTDFFRPSSRPQSVGELGSQATEAAQRTATTDFFRPPPSRPQSSEMSVLRPAEDTQNNATDVLRPLSGSPLHELAARSGGSESQQRDLPSRSGDEIMQMSTRPESRQSDHTVATEASESTPADIKKLLERLNIVQLDIARDELDVHYTMNAERAQDIKDALQRIDELKESIEETKKLLVAESRLGRLSRIYSPPHYRIDMQIGRWTSDGQIAKLDSKIASINSLVEEHATFLRKGLAGGHTMLIEGHKKVIRLNDRMAGTLVNPSTKILLALGVAAIGSISSSVIANEVLVSAVVSNILATGVETRLFEKVAFPLNVVSNGVQWTGMNTGAYLTQRAIEKKHAKHNETIGQGHNFTTEAFADLLTDPFVNATIRNMLLGRLDELTKSGTVTIELTRSV